MHSGQICMATERIIVDNKVAAEFTTALAEEGERDDGGRPEEPRDQLGPLIRKAAVDHVT